MAFHVTAKAVRENYGKIIRMGYCSAHYLLMFHDKIAYTSGTYGWNADVYQIDGNTAIVTGYRPFGNVDPRYEILEKYEKKAEELWNSREIWKSENIREKIEKLLKEYVDYVAYDFKYQTPILPYEELEC